MVTASSGITLVLCLRAIIVRGIAIGVIIIIMPCFLSGNLLSSSQKREALHHQMGSSTLLYSLRQSLTPLPTAHLPQPQTYPHQLIQPQSNQIK